MRLEKADDLFWSMHEELCKRQASDPKSTGEPMYWLIFGLHCATTSLRRPLEMQDASNANDSTDVDSMRIVDTSRNPTGYNVLLETWRQGATHNLRSIVWMDHFATFMAQYPGQLDQFDLRVGFTMPDADSVLFVSEPHGSQIGENGAVFSGAGKRQRFRPYKKPRLDWLKELCDCVAGKQR